MRNVIYKYVLDFSKLGDTEIEVPNCSKFLKLGVQNDQIVLWYLVEVDEHIEYGNHKEKFKVVMTGEYFDESGMEYLDTCTLKGWIVCHVFKRVI